MTAATIDRREAEPDVLRDVLEALQEHERLQAQVRASEARLRALCRRWDDAAGVWGTAPHHLRQTCVARGLL
jgi:hypothetical protein